MRGRIEVEFKLALPDEAARERLLRALDPGGSGAPAAVVQENRFFDTADGWLRGREYALRLRTEKARHELALKGPGAAQSASALHSRAEEECVLSEETAAAVLAGRRSPLALLLTELPGSEFVRAVATGVGERPLACVGAFRNERTRLPTLRADLGPRPLCLELDRTTFPGERVEHELEVELADPEDALLVERGLRALLVGAGIPWIPARSKAERFFRLLDARGGA